MKAERRAFSGEEADWKDMHKDFTSQARILGFAGELVATDKVKVGAEDFNSQGIDPLGAKRASETWLSPITTCKGTALEIVQSLVRRGGNYYSGIVPVA